MHEIIKKLFINVSLFKQNIPLRFLKRFFFHLYNGTLRKVESRAGFTCNFYIPYYSFFQTYADNSFCKQKAPPPEWEVQGVKLKGECRAYSSISDSSNNERSIRLRLLDLLVISFRITQSF